MFYDVCGKTGHVFNSVNRSTTQRRTHERSTLTTSDQRHLPYQQGFGRGGHDHPMPSGHPADRGIGGVPHFIIYVKWMLTQYQRTRIFSWSGSRASRYSLASSHYVVVRADQADSSQSWERNPFKIPVKPGNHNKQSLFILAKFPMTRGFPQPIPYRTREEID
jgi:hypothetical protein